MHLRQLLFLSALLLLTICCDDAVSQRRRLDTPLRRPCDVPGPLTKLEEFDWKMETVIVRGSTQVSTLFTRTGATRVDALELRDEGTPSRALGVVIELRDTSRQDVTPESRSYIDYEEIDPLIRAWDRVARTDDTITKLNNFESRYRTKSDFELVVFRQTPGGTIAAAVSGGVCDRVKIYLSLDEFIKLRHMVAQAKERLDELR
jgi:hypothetical protein